ncbi:MAG: outer membrane protein transport protein, partial [Candidatus Thiodiazotropha sp.]
FAQGGMGTEYKSTSPGASFVFAGGMHPYGGSSGNPYTPLASGQNITDATLQGQVAGWEEMSEVGVMRILFPVSYMVNDKLNVGGSIDYVRATMDLKMVMTGAMMSDMMNPAAQNIGTMSGSMVNLLDGWMQAGAISDIYGAQFDFADSNPYSGKTEGDGFAGKIGFTYQVNSKLTIGGTYHSETSLSDLTGNATANMAVNSVPFGGEVLVPLKGKIKIKDFQWPSTIGIGLAYQVNDKTKIAADVKKINWSDVMKDFKMSFTAGGNTGGAAAFNGYTMDAVMYQNWDDQTVYELGVSHQLNEAWVLRAGANVANNPIPDATMHYLFPAIVETHYTAGFGYTVSDKDEVNFSATYAPEVEQKNDMGLTVSHSQTNWQLMYSHSF